MSWREVVEGAARRADVSGTTSRAVLAAFVNEVIERVASGEPVLIPGLGTVAGQWGRERTLRSVSDGRKIAVDAHFHPTFRSSKRLRLALRERTPQLLRDPAHQRAWRLAEALVGDVAIYAGPVQPGPFDPDADLSQVEQAARATFGQAWTRARATFEEQTTREVRDSRDHLAAAVRRRWKRTD